ncbi:MAG TPA: hypothetical protein VFE13_06725 [Caulobacteraceae bacterium]|jgi:hypothetical protein|nr:hypothetical protein [Caulobacteraceae bacterium]
MTIDVIGTDVLATDAVADWEQRPAAAFSALAVIGGAIAAIAITLILFSLGSGLGFAAASPWGNTGDTAAKLGVAAGIWLVLTQWLSSAAGGYLTGRLRTRWHRTHTHEVFFRDTAHGFLAWALATAIVGVVAAATGLAGTGGAVATGATATAAELAYDADTLYRTPTGDAAVLAPVKAEAARLLAATGAKGGAPGQDEHAWLVASIASRAGVTTGEAERRVGQVIQREHDAATAAKIAADKARGAAATAAILTALAMVIGAFIASVAAVLGGVQRDEHI